MRADDVQVLHGFESIQDAEAYLSSELFTNDVVVALKPFLKDNPDVRIYAVAQLTAIRRDIHSMDIPVPTEMS